MARLFGENRLVELANKIDTAEIKDLINIVRTWHNDYHNGSLRKDKETSREQAYNQDFFIKILGYEEKPASPYSLEPKATTEKGQLPDAVLSYTDTSKEIANIAAVVELKGANIELDRPQRREGNMSPVQQGFKYKTQYRNCPFVIVCNFWEFRLYRDNLLDYEVWTLDDLVKPEHDYHKFKAWYVLLKSDNFISSSGPSKTEELLSDIRIEQEEIGKKFYKIYKGIRIELLRDIYKNNVHIRKDIDKGIEKTQKIIDRIVFVCFAEDKGLLPDNTLQRVLKAADSSAFGGSLWNTLKSFFEAVDTGSKKLEIPHGYNGGLFKRDDELNNLHISDDPLRTVLELGTYNFKDDLSVTILGHIFEQSITDLEEIKNKVNESNNLESLSQGRRKKDGIFYTPDYIVRYIVDNSLGIYLREQEAKCKEDFRLKGDINDENYEKREILAYTRYQDILQNVKVIDPACGSGAFLVYVFDYLLTENIRVASILGGGLFSSENYIRSILRNNVYGVDLNEESVEITKLSLWLKSAEKDKQLTTLDKNIKCGNSLSSDPSLVGIKAFDWFKEFPEIMSEGGFNVVVMNPPYVKESEGKQIFAGLHCNPIYQGKMDLWYFFGALALNIVQKKTGIIGLIAPSNWITNDGASKFRSKIAQDAKLEKFVDFGDYKVFDQAGIQTMIMIMRSDSSAQNYKVLYSKLINKQVDNNIVQSYLNSVVDKDFLRFTTLLNRKDIGSRIITFVDNIENKLLDKLKNHANFYLLKEEIFSGIDIGQDYVNKKSKSILGEGFNIGDGIFNIAQELYNSSQFNGYERNNILKPFYTPKEINRYIVDNINNAWVIYTRNSKEISEDHQYRNIKQHLDRYQCVITSANKPYGLHRARDKGIFAGDKILSIRKCLKPSFSFVDFDTYVNRTYLIIKTDRTDMRYLTGVLNSKIIHFWLLKQGKLQGDIMQVDISPLTSIPIVVAKNTNEIAILVEAIINDSTKLHRLNLRFLNILKAEYGVIRMSKDWLTGDFSNFTKGLNLKLSLKQKDELIDLFQKYKLEGGILNNKIKAHENEINHLIYQLYNLTPDEVALIES